MEKTIKNIVIISNESQIDKLLKSNLDFNNTEIITFNENLNILIKNNRRDITPKFYDDLNLNIKDWEDCLKEAKEFFDNWKGIKIGEKEVFTEMLGYNKFSLLDIDAVRYLSAHTEIIANLLFKISVIKSIMNELKPKIVVTLSPKTDWERIARLVCYKESVKMIEHKRWLDNIDLYFEKLFYECEIKLFNKKLKVKIPFTILPFVVRLRSRWELFRGKIGKENNPSIDDNREILFFILNRKYLDVVMPVVESIQKDAVFKPLVLVPANFDASEALKERNIPFECVELYLTGEDVRDSNRIYSDIVKRWEKIKKEKDFKEGMYRHQDLNLEDFMSKEVGKTILLSASSIKNILLMKRIAMLHRPKVLVTPHISENIVKSLTASCKEMGISIIVIKRGSAIWTPEYSLFDGDRLLVAGKHAKEVFCKWGVETDKIIVTGPPIFDELLVKLKDKKDIERKIRNALDIDSKIHIITYLTQNKGGRFGYQERLNEIRTVYNVVKRMDDVFLIVKIHPTESDVEDYGGIAEEIGLERYALVRNELPLDDLLLSSKIALTKESTTGFNALIAGAMLIVVGFHDKKFSNNFFVEDRVAMQAISAEELHNNIRKTLTADNEDLIQIQKVNEFLENHFCKLDCKSAERMKDEIYSLIGGTQKLYI